MTRDWELAPLSTLGDYVGQTVLIICDEGSYEGGLKGFSETNILVEIGEGQVLAIRRDILLNDLTELYVLEERK